MFSPVDTDKLRICVRSRDTHALNRHCIPTRKWRPYHLNQSVWLFAGFSRDVAEARRPPSRVLCRRWRPRFRAPRPLPGL